MFMGKNAGVRRCRCGDVLGVRFSRIRIRVRVRIVAFYSLLHPHLIIQPFGHNRNGPKIGGCVPFWGKGSWVPI